MEEYYTPEAVDSLISSIYSAEDSIKYIYNVSPQSEDFKLLTPELEVAFSNLAAACEELNRIFNYYSEVKRQREKRQNAL